ncbi:hypothetical protein GCM10009836_50250 [Pseudonocardia ailaonensis]|uniref:Uncharacterized protein n=1 Tax=Pseudonocardia ailaonensis TaxID=367279 RepID=A0ABN2NDY8_9PSEU
MSVDVHADGFGTPVETTTALHRSHEAAPPGITWAGRAFSDEDRPLLDPAATVAVRPERPVLASYR